MSVLFIRKMSCQKEESKGSEFAIAKEKLQGMMLIQLTLLTEIREHANAGQKNLEDWTKGLIAEAATFCKN